MHTLWLWLIIPGAVITYLVIGFFVFILLSKWCGHNWADEIDMASVFLIFIWPITLALVVITVLPMQLLQRIADVTRKDHKDE